KFPFLASGKAQALGHTEGFVQILSDPKHGEILGVHMVGENVTELIAELGLAKSMEATTDEIRARPSSMTAAAVSSQDVSMASKRIFLSILENFDDFLGDLPHSI
ncbi:MAG: hypothetical protein L6461_20390, partial [Anaerolineae bacterium]|nr:hypothetical protein [Anaerolineae bacterium]